MYKILQILVIIQFGVWSAKLSSKKWNIDCSGWSENELRELLGPAYNPRYMSIQEPQKIASIDEETGMKRTLGDFAPNFYVNDDWKAHFIESDSPAWSAKYTIENVENTRSKRSPASGSKKIINVMEELDINMKESETNQNQQRPWECESRISWLDLGRDYFPRYLRTVECMKHDCWYGHYTCKPRSFTVKLLRRRAGVCASLKMGAIKVDQLKIGQEGLPMDLRQLWVWEERAVTFCCDCAA